MDSLKSKIEACNAKFMEHYKSNDMKAVSELYTEDCRIMPPGSDVLFGREAAVKMFEETYANGLTNLVLQTEEVGTVDTNAVAFERGSYTFSDKDGKELDVGKFLVIWKCISEKWHLYTDMFSPNKS